MRGGGAGAGVVLVLVLGSVGGCEPLSDTVLDLFRDQPVTVREAFLTPFERADNLDSPAVWRTPSGGAWLLVTAKETDVIAIYDGSDGRPLARVGGRGSEPGKFHRPNGIAVIEDLVLVVERDNHRVQVLSLPDFRPVLLFGADVLVRPYGITVFHAPGGESIEVYVTDNGDALEKRVKHFRLLPVEQELEPQLIRSFGERSGEGVLWEVESIAADPAHDRLLIVDEEAFHIKVYALDGAYTGRILGDGLYDYQPEGVVLQACGTGGHWITTEQRPDESAFHLFDRETLEYVGAFRGQTIANTDGIALSPPVSRTGMEIVFYAQHDDGAAGAMYWDEIARALGIPAKCPPAETVDP